MLSIENSPDPTCSCKISGLKNDERASGKLALQEADQLKSGLADDDQLSPTFSIRDYVFAVRSKDIETNWPFPQQYLQLCLKYGVKDLLPPFEPPDSVRNRCSRKGLESGQLAVHVNGRKSVEEDNSREENVSYLDGESNCVKCKSCLPIDQSVLGSLNQAPSPLQEQEKFTVGHTDTKLCRLSKLPGLNQGGREGEVLSTVTSHARSERESVPTNRLPCSAQEATTLSEDSIELEVPGPPSSPQKNENTIEPSGKKCRLIVKLGTISDPSRTEEIVSNTTTISEPMAKVCPVCKTFSSTSNTTLNAHIDQCLAVESTSNWAVNSELTKHRVKPRKKRLMVDIYVTAPRCTLEDLDRRNGSNWATDLSLQTAQADVCAEGKRQRPSPVDLEDVGNESAVYFDSNGTKLRILSKFNDASVPTVGVDSRPKKHMKDSKESNTFPTGKKRHLGSKHSKYLKLKSQNNKVCSLKPDRAKIHGAAKGKYGMDENQEKEECLSQILKACDQISPSDSGTLKQWVCSKRTGLLKKFNSKDGCQDLGYSSTMTCDPLIEGNQSTFGNLSMEGSCILKFPYQSENTAGSPKSRRVESQSYRDHITDNGEKSRQPSESNVDRLTNGSTASTHGGCVLKLSRSSGSFASSPRSKRVDVHAGPVENSRSLLQTTVNPSEGCHLFTPEVKKLSSSRKNVLLVGPSFPKSKFCENKKGSTLKKSRMHRYMTKMGEQVGALPSDVDEPYDRVNNSTENLSGSLNHIRATHKSDGWNNFMRPETDEVSIGRSDVLEPGQGRETLSTSGREEPVALETLQSLPEYCGLDLVATVDSHVGVCLHQFHSGDNFTCRKSIVLESAEEVPLNEDSVIEPSIGGHSIKSSETLVSEFHKPANPSNARSNCLRYIEEHKRPVYGTDAWTGLTEQSLCDYQETCCANEVGNGIICQSTHMASEMECRAGGVNSFSEIQYTGCVTDPIPIPGPPGSFLPSPGDISSEILQENSSLTSSRLPSSQDRHVLVDIDSSGSPVSATSTISHPFTARSDSKYAEPESSVEPPAVQDKFISGYSDDGTKPVVGDATTFPCATSIGGAEIINLEESLKVTTISPAAGPAKFSDQSCCCSWKESIPQGAALTYQESQLLGLHTMAPVMLPAKQMTYNKKIRPEIFTSVDCLSTRIDEMLVPISDSSRGPISMKASPDAALKFPSHGELCPASPSSQAHPQSTSNPVLRLMGKNLMVVNKEVDASMQVKQALTSAPNDHTNAKYMTLLEFSTPVGNCNMHVGGHTGIPLMQHGSTSGSDFQTRQKRPVNKPNFQFTCNVEKVVATPHFQHQKPASAAQASANPIPEVIVIDDSPENEANLSMINAKYTQGSRGSQPSPVGILSPTASDSNLRQLTAFSCYQSHNSISLREPPVGPKPSFLGSCPRGANTNSVKQGDLSECSNVLPRGTFMVPSPLTGHRRLYYSSSLS